MGVFSFHQYDTSIVGLRFNGGCPSRATHVKYLAELHERAVSDSLNIDLHRDPTQFRGYSSVLAF